MVLKMSSAQDELKHHPTARMLGKIRKRFQSLGNRALAICAATALVVCILEVLRLPPVHPELSDAELRLEDHYFLLRNYLWPNGSWKSSASSDIVLVSVDEESARKLGLADAHQWPKDIFAGLIKKLEAANCDVVVLDVPLDATTELKSAVDLSEKSGVEASPTLAPDTASGAQDGSSNSALLNELQHSKNIVLTSGVDKSPNATGSGAAHGNSLVLLRSPGHRSSKLSEKTQVLWETTS